MRHGSRQVRRRLVVVNNTAEEPICHWWRWSTAHPRWILRPEQGRHRTGRPGRTLGRMLIPMCTPRDSWTVLPHTDQLEERHTRPGSTPPTGDNRRCHYKSRRLKNSRGGTYPRPVCSRLERPSRAPRSSCNIVRNRTHCQHGMPSCSEASRGRYLDQESRQHFPPLHSQCYPRARQCPRWCPTPHRIRRRGPAPTPSRRVGRLAVRHENRASPRRTTSHRQANARPGAQL